MTLLLCRALFVTDAVTHGRTDGRRDREMDTQVKDLLASRVPPKGNFALTFGGTEGLMLGRRGWFDALSKSMVRCQIEGNGLMLSQRG